MSTINTLYIKHKYIILTGLTIMQFITKEKTIEHPLENLFDITPNSTIVEYQEAVPEPIVEQINYDSKDDDIEGRLEEIYAVAMGQATLLSDECEMVEGKFKARIAETGAAMLNIALGSVRERRMMKEHKDKLTPHRNIGTVNNNTLVVNDNVLADRNEILKAFLSQGK